MRIGRTAIIAAVAAVSVLVGACGDDGDRTAAPASDRSTGTPPTQSAGARYAHLGDSFAAGSGIDPTVPDSPAMCLRSQLDFGRLVAARRGVAPADFADVSCGAATTAALSTDQFFGVPPQVDVLGGRTELVTLLIGGNDDRLFADVVADCASAAVDDLLGQPCRAKFGNGFDERVDDDVAPALDDAVALVHRRAPHARLLVVGYPRILPEHRGCFPVMRIATGDVAYVNEVAVRLNRAIATAARAHGATYVDMWSVSQGHDACAGLEQRWVEPMMGSRIRTTVHPNAAGQRAMADAVTAALR